MFDFRYHAISLAAVFLALAVGLLLGIAIGDEQLVSSVRNQLEDRLQEELDDSRAEARSLREELEQARAYEEQTLPGLVRDRLGDRRVAVVFMHGRNEAVFNDVRGAVRAAGGQLTTAFSLRSPIPLDEVADSAAGTRYEGLPDDPSLLEPFGERLGRQIVQPGRLLRRVRRAVMSSTAGELQTAEAVVVVHGEPRDRPREEAQAAEAFEAAVVQGLGAFKTPVVGVEATGTDPSQIGWYRARGIASVDNVDQTPGQASLVLALAGVARGAYGVKSTRDAFLPDALTEGP